MPPRREQLAAREDSSRLPSPNPKTKTLEEYSDSDDEISMVRMTFWGNSSSTENDTAPPARGQGLAERVQGQEERIQVTSRAAEGPDTDLVQLISTLMIVNRGGSSSESSESVIPIVDDTSQEKRGSTREAENEVRVSKGQEDTQNHQEPLSEDNASQSLEDGATKIKVAPDSTTTAQEHTPDDPTTAEASGPPLTSPALSRSSSKSREEECSICQNPYTSHSTLQPCGHEFDFKCIMTWLEEVFRTKYSIRELKCPLCRKTINAIREQGTSHRFDIIRHFRDLARGQRWPRSVSGNFSQFVVDLFRGSSGHGRAGADGLHPWERESITLFGHREHLHRRIASQQRLALAILEEMGEGASTDIDYGSGVPGVQGNYPPYSLQQHYPNQHSQHVSRYGRESEIDRWQQIQERESSMPHRPDGPSHIPPWQRRLREQTQIQQRHAKFLERAERGESELRAKAASSTSTQTAIREVRPQSARQEALAQPEQHPPTQDQSQQQDRAQSLNDTPTLSYEQQIENVDPATLAELPQWIKEEVRWAEEAAKRKKMHRPTWDPPSRPASPPNPARTAAVIAGSQSYLQPTFPRSNPGYGGSRYNGRDNSRENSGPQAQSGGPRNREESSKGDTQGPGRIEYFDPYLDEPEEYIGD